MTEAQKNKCREIIASNTILSGSANAVCFIPGLGFGKGVDLAAITAMAKELAVVFGQTITEEVAKEFAADALKKAYFKHSAKATARELARLVPLLGMAFTSCFSVEICETAGWDLANELERKFCNCYQCGKEKHPNCK